MPQKSLSAALRFAGAACMAAALSGCGGGMPLLHPAHTLAKGIVTAGAGVSGQFVTGQSSHSVDPRQQAGNQERAYLEEKISDASFAPGVAPWVGARLGLGYDTEAGLTYLGRSLRIDARHAFGNETWALSVGAGASGVLGHVEAGSESGAVPPVGYGRFDPRGSDVTPKGWAFDVPILFGYRSTASVVQAWVGARGGVERLTAEFGLIEGIAPPPETGPPTITTPVAFADVSALRWYGGGLVGMAVGFRPVWVAVELDVAYNHVGVEADFRSGDPRRQNVDLSGVTLAPAGAIIGKF
jgi:hypothetical protein